MANGRLTTLTTLLEHETKAPLLVLEAAPAYGGKDLRTPGGDGSLGLLRVYRAGRASFHDDLALEKQRNEWLDVLVKNHDIVEMSLSCVTSAFL